MFVPVPTLTTVCGHEVARLAAGRFNVDGLDDGYTDGLEELSAALTGCPTPDTCAADVAWRLDEEAA